MKQFLRSCVAVAGLAALTTPATSLAARCSAVPTDLDRAVGTFTGTPRSHYAAAFHDLNGDHRPEALVYLTEQAWCGTGGCTLLVFERRQLSWQPAGKVTLVRPPIQALSRRSNGWASLAVQVSGGGLPRPYTAELPFYQHRYPENASVPPARPIAGRVHGITLIDSSGCAPQGGT